MVLASFSPHFAGSAFCSVILLVLYPLGGLVSHIDVAAESSQSEQAGQVEQLLVIMSRSPYMRHDFSGY